MAERLKIGADLRDAFEAVRGEFPSQAEPVILIAWYLHELSKEYGLSEHGDIDDPACERIDLPAEANGIVTQYLVPDGRVLDDDLIRERLYKIFLALADEQSSRELVNRHGTLSSAGFLEITQVFWNIEGNNSRGRLPIRAGEEVSGESGHTEVFDIKVPGQMKDFALMRASDRAKLGARVGRNLTTRGGSFRKQGARIAVLAASRLVEISPIQLPLIEGAELIAEENSRGRTEWALVWQSREADTPSQQETDAVHSSAAHNESPTQSVYAPRSGDRPRVFVDQGYSSVGPRYVSREHDRDLDRVWGSQGNRAVWLCGGAGRGKSFSARRVMEQALGQQEDAEELLIWVESADAVSVTRALASAADEMPYLGITHRRQEIEAPSPHPSGSPSKDKSGLSPTGETPGVLNYREGVEEHPGLRQMGAGDRLWPIQPTLEPEIHDELDEMLYKSRALLRILLNSNWRWLLVYDNANAAEIIDQNLVPTGSNPNGRVLITTQYSSYRLSDHGEVINVGTFDADEAESFVRARLPGAGEEDRRALISVTGGLPLALSIATSTITANAMEPRDWISEFEAAQHMDDAADESDSGGYPHSLSRTWSVALGRASQNLPDGVVERAALISAVQSPDGYPTWLWDSPAVARWVDDGAVVGPQRGTPLAVKRLIEHGVVELQGQSWKRGVVAMHQLACRAIKERRPAEEIGELVDVLAREWLRSLTDEDLAIPTGLHENMQALSDALKQLPEEHSDSIAVAALLEYSRPSPARKMHSDWDYDNNAEEWLDLHIEMLETCLPLRQVLAPANRLLSLASESAEIAHLQRMSMRDGPDAKYFDLAIELYREVISDPESTLAERADASADLGKLHDKFDNAGDADRSRANAADLWQLLIDSESIGDAERAKGLLNRAKVLESLGRESEAHTDRTRAVALYETLAFSAPPVDEIFEYVEALKKLYQLLGTQQTWISTLTHLHDALVDAVEVGPWSDSPMRWTTRFETLAAYQQEIGRVDEAIRSLERAIEVLDSPSSPHTRRFIKEIAALHCSLQQWSHAELALARLADLSTGSLDPETQVLVASLAMQQGETERAESTLRLAVAKYQDVAERSIHQIEATPAVTPAWRESYYDVVQLRLSVMASTENSLGRTDAENAILALLADRSEMHLASTSNNDPDQQRERALELSRIVLMRFVSGSRDRAIQTADKAIAILGLLLDLNPDDKKLREELELVFRARALSLEATGDEKAVLGARGDLVKFCRDNVDRDIEDTAAQRSLASALQMLGWAQFDRDDVEEGQKNYLGALNILRTLTELNSDDLESLVELADGHGALAIRLGMIDLLEESHQQRELQIASLDRLIEMKPSEIQYRAKFSDAAVSQASALNKVGRLEEASQWLNRGQSVLTEFVPESDLERAEVAQQRIRLEYFSADIEQQRGDSAQKYSYLTSAIADARLVVEYDPHDLRAQCSLAAMLALEGDWRSADGQVGEVREALGSAIKIGLMVAEIVDDGVADQTVSAFLRQLPEVLRSYRDVLSELGEDREARAAEEQAAEMERRFPPADPESEED